MSNVLLWHPTCILDAPDKIVRDPEVDMQKSFVHVLHLSQKYVKKL